MALVFLAFIIAALSGSSNPIFIRFATAEIPPLTFSAIRFLLAAALLFPIWQKQKQHIPLTQLYKILPYTVNMGLYAIAIQFTSATMGSILYTLAPIFTAVLAYYLLEEKLSKSQVIGAAIAIFGTATLIQGSIETRDIFSFGTPLGNMLIFIAVCSWGFYPIGARSLSKSYKTSTILFYTFAITGFISLCAAPLEWLIRPLVIADVSQVTFVSIVGSALIGTLLFYFCYQWLIKNTTAFIASLNLYGGFVATSSYGALFLGEHFTKRLAFGALLVLGGVFLATTYNQLKKHR